MKRKRRKSKLMIDFMELIKETTKFRRDAQYLQNPDGMTAVNRDYGVTPKSSWASAWWPRNKLHLYPCREQRWQQQGGAPWGCGSGLGIVGVPSGWVTGGGGGGEGCSGGYGRAGEHMVRGMTGWKKVQ